MQGTIKVESSLISGSNFTVKLLLKSIEPEFKVNESDEVS